MERAEVLEVLRDRAVALLEVAAEDVREDVSLRADLRVDSLSLVEYTMELEDHFGICLPEDELAGAPTVGRLADLVTARLAASS